MGDLSNVQDVINVIVYMRSYIRQLSYTFIERISSIWYLFVGFQYRILKLLKWDTITS